MLQSTAAPRSREPASDSTHLRHLIEQEIPRLPAKYRAAIVACYLQGQTNRDAARALGWPLGTLVTRLNRAKAALRVRVAARLKKETDTALTAALNRRTAPAVVPLALLASTLRAARKVHAIPRLPQPTPPFSTRRAPSHAPLRVAAAKVQALGVSALSIAVVLVGACLALGAIHHTNPAPSLQRFETRIEADRSVHPSRPHPSPTAPVVAPAESARAVAAALTRANRDTLGASKRPVRH